MSMYHKFLVQETDRFVPDNFPPIKASLETIVVLLNREPAGPKADMLLSFVKDHSMSSQHVAEHPGLASLISTKSLPLGSLEALFESSRNNPLFKKDLEAYIRSYFAAAHLY